jgi:5-methylthioadenosine/S-adenosylhomocysteine deaminase
MKRILIENGFILTVNDDDEIHEPGYILIEGDHITALGPGLPPGDLKSENIESIDATGMVVMPGMINGHVHLQQTLVRGLADDRGVLDWVFNIAFPIYFNMSEEDIYLAELVGIIENLRGGATAVTNNLTVRASSGAFDACFRAGKDSGIRYKLARGFNERNVPERITETGDEILEDMRRLYGRYHNQENGRLRLDFNPHTLSLVKPETLHRANELAHEWGIGIHLHTAESREEVAHWADETGQRQVEWLASEGLLGPHFQLAHSVQLDQNEINLVAESGACIVHNPVSNAFTGAGILPVLELLEAGATVALGTDGQAVANGREMLDVLAWTTNLQKAKSENTIGIRANQVLQMACRDGSKAFGQPDEIGSLEVGKKADVILISLEDSRLTLPTLNLPSLVVNFSRTGDVDTAIVNGKILLRNRQITFLDESELLKEFAMARKAVIQRAGILAH